MAAATVGVGFGWRSTPAGRGVTTISATSSACPAPQRPVKPPTFIWSWRPGWSPRTDSAFPFATEWIENPEGGEYDKQDCKRKGFARLAATLKEACPRLPMLILADGLYPSLPLS